eukprot:gb/GEZN01002787.1/.p1 GENE.gb/GEZN01002787.1/~~gb/GEZN01002787.1/.p1  ORF type:complete len:697 (-),score=45.79 gb/GEZN01002787.1/:271-2253(-)
MRQLVHHGTYKKKSKVQGVKMYGDRTCAVAATLGLLRCVDPWGFYGWYPWQLLLFMDTTFTLPLVFPLMGYVTRIFTETAYRTSMRRPPKKLSLYCTVLTIICVCLVVCPMFAEIISPVPAAAAVTDVGVGSGLIVFCSVAGFICIGALLKTVEYFRSQVRDAHAGELGASKTFNANEAWIKQKAITIKTLVIASGYLVGFNAGGLRYKSAWELYHSEPGTLVGYRALKDKASEFSIQVIQNVALQVTFWTIVMYYVYRSPNQNQKIFFAIKKRVSRADKSATNGIRSPTEGKSRSKYSQSEVKQLNDSKAEKSPTPGGEEEPRKNNSGDLQDDRNDDDSLLIAHKSIGPMSCEPHYEEQGSVIELVGNGESSSSAGDSISGCGDHHGLQLSIPPAGSQASLNQTTKSGLVRIHSGVDAPLGRERSHTDPDGKSRPRASFNNLMNFPKKMRQLLHRPHTLQTGPRRPQTVGPRMDQVEEAAPDGFPCVDIDEPADQELSASPHESSSKSLFSPSDRNGRFVLRPQTEQPHSTDGFPVDNKEENAKRRNSTPDLEMGSRRHQLDDDMPTISPGTESPPIMMHHDDVHALDSAVATPDTTSRRIDVMTYSNMLPLHPLDRPSSTSPLDTRHSEDLSNLSTPDDERHAHHQFLTRTVSAPAPS